MPVFSPCLCGPHLLALMKQSVGLLPPGQLVHADLVEPDGSPSALNSTNPAANQSQLLSSLGLTPGREGPAVFQDVIVCVCVCVCVCV
jgi:hypothetical protein